ncbi:MAG: hypothetical protein LBC75_07505 [Fibromonadaceae bacterium]|nr:hypothetical protein [Fibromonadaceae bacterium]
MLAIISQFFAKRAIKACSDKNALEIVFEKHKISDLEQRINLLLRIMGNPAVSYSCGYPEVEDRYEAIVSAYLSGVWKRNYSSWAQQGEYNYDKIRKETRVFS